MWIPCLIYIVKYFVVGLLCILLLFYIRFRYISETRDPPPRAIKIDSLEFSAWYTADGEYLTTKSDSIIRVSFDSCCCWSRRGVLNNGRSSVPAIEDLRRKVERRWVYSSYTLSLAQHVEMSMMVSSSCRLRNNYYYHQHYCFVVRRYASAGARCHSNHNIGRTNRLL